MTEAGAGGGDMLSMMGGADWELLDGDTRFAPPERRDFPNPEPFDTERLLALARSTSALATMEPDEREGVLERLATLTREHPDLRGRGTFEMPLVTVAVRTALA
jgi:hypothetical protein